MEKKSISDEEIGSRIQDLLMNAKVKLREIDGYDTMMVILGILIPLGTFLVLYFAQPKIVLSKKEGSEELVRDNKKITTLTIAIGLIVWLILIVCKYWI